MQKRFKNIKPKNYSILSRLSQMSYLILTYYSYQSFLIQDVKFFLFELTFCFPVREALFSEH